MLSIQDEDSVPKEIQEILERVRKSANIMPKSQLEKMLKQELGNNWMDNFEEFDYVPIGAGIVINNVQRP
jgi:aarF domain-containing kinase